MAQMSVAKTNRISKAARRLFFSPNWIGVKARLKTKLSAKGKATQTGTCFCQASKKTLPKETAMRMYKKVHTGPKSHDGGDQEGFIS